MDTQSGWGAVIAGGGWPAVMLVGASAIGVVVRGPSFMRWIGKEWKQENAKDRDELDNARDRFYDQKDRELTRLRGEVTEKDAKIESLYDRVNRLMRAIYYWRDLARDFRHGWVNERMRHQSWEGQHSIEVLEDNPQIRDTPGVDEDRDAWMFTSERR